MINIYWVRNDQRLHDNSALYHFLNENQAGIAIWIASPSFHRAKQQRKDFILHNLAHFEKSLGAHGLKLYCFDRSFEQVWDEILTQDQKIQVYYSSEYTPEEIQEESKLRKRGIQLRNFDQQTLIHQSDLPFLISNLPPVFTQFRNQVERSLSIQPPLSPPEIKWESSEFHFSIPQLQLDALNPSSSFIPSGEKAALERLKDYIWNKDLLKIYKETRNGMLEWDDSSKFSPWLSIGAISARQIYSEIKKYENLRISNESTYWLFFELLWRDYFKFNALKQGAKLFQSSSQRHNSDHLELFKKWTEAQTGDDFIDACMNELNLTGWMSNRGRQNVASYLAKTLKVPWIWGADYFEEHLIDYDASSNWGNWAYLAGVGQDPRNRTFNAQRQASMYDPDFRYRLKWSPNKIK